MAHAKLVFTKDWNNPEDFPTIETSEVQVRADIQLLYDECKDAINALSTELDGEAPFIAVSGTTTYAQITAALSAGLAVFAKDTQGSGTILPFAALDTGNNSYVFSGMVGDTRRSAWCLPNSNWNYNSTPLAKTDSVALTGNPTAPTQTTGNNSTRIATTAFVKNTLDAARTAWDALVTMFSGITAVGTTLNATNSEIPTSKAVLDALSSSGYGDMLKANYDSTNTGTKVDTALNAERLGGVVASQFMTLSSGAVIPEYSDLDDYNTIGNYECQTEAIAGTVANKPWQMTGTNSGSFILKVFDTNGAGGGTHLVQELYGSGTGRTIYRRAKTSLTNTWGPWARVAHSEMLSAGMKSASSRSELEAALNAWLDTMSTNQLGVFYLNVPANPSSDITPFIQAGYAVLLNKRSADLATATFVRSAGVGPQTVWMNMTAAGVWQTPTVYTFGMDGQSTGTSSVARLTDLNRSNPVQRSNTSYDTAMARAIKAVTDDPGKDSTLTSGTILLVYEE